VTDVREDWQKEFLERFRSSGNLTTSAQQSGVHRSTVLRERQRNEDFALAYADAELQGAESVEAFVRARATVGQPVVRTRRKYEIKRNENGDPVLDTKGEPVRILIEEEVTEERYISTAAALAMLRAHHPDYKLASANERAGQVLPPVPIEVNRVPTKERMEGVALDRVGAGLATEGTDAR
jgi:hypothetical protein